MLKKFIEMFNFCNIEIDLILICKLIFTFLFHNVFKYLK
jgi:hypothetical protein